MQMSEENNSLLIFFRFLTLYMYVFSYLNMHIIMKIKKERRLKNE